MSKPDYDNQKIADYLLGNLSEDEAERFDELSFTDENFARRLESAEKDLIDAYVNGELAETALVKFKTHYLVSPLRRDKVRFAETFQTFAAQNINEAHIKKKESFESESATGFFSSINIFANPARRWAFAVLVLAFVVGGFLLVRRQLNNANDVAVNLETPAPTVANQTDGNMNSGAVIESPPENKNVNNLPNINQEVPKKTPTPQMSIVPTPEKNATPPKPIIASFILTPPLRGGGGLQNISFSKETETIKITLKLEGNDYQNYRVALTDETGKNLWQSGSLRSRNESLNVIFPAKLLKQQIYSLVVSGINADGEAEIISNYSFRTVLR